MDAAGDDDSGDDSDDWDTPLHAQQVATPHSRVQKGEVRVPMHALNDESLVVADWFAALFTITAWFAALFTITGTNCSRALVASPSSTTVECLLC